MVQNSKNIKMYTWNFVFTPLSFSYSLPHSHQEKKYCYQFLFHSSRSLQSMYKHVHILLLFSFCKKRSKPYTWFCPLIFFNNVYTHSFISIHTDFIPFFRCTIIYLTQSVLLKILGLFSILWHFKLYKEQPCKCTFHTHEYLQFWRIFSKIFYISIIDLHSHYYATIIYIYQFGEEQYHSDSIR